MYVLYILSNDQIIKKNYAVSIILAIKIAFYYSQLFKKPKDFFLFHFFLLWETLFETEGDISEHPRGPKVRVG